MARIGTAVDRAPAGSRPRDTVAVRLATAFERRLARSVALRLGSGAGDRQPGALERRIVRALERRLAARRHPIAAPTARSGVIRLRPSARHLPVQRQTTLRELVLAVLAGGIVRALAILLRIVSRGLIGAPMRRLGRLLLRNAARAGPVRGAGLVALALGLVGLLVQRLAAGSGAGGAALKLILALARIILRAVWALIRGSLRRAASAGS